MDVALQSRLALCAVAWMGLVGCSPNETAQHYLQRRAGVSVCSSVKIMEPNRPGDTWDFNHFVFHVEGRCKAQFLQSVYVASAGECAAMLPKNGSCIYFGGGKPSVVVHGRVTGGEFGVTTY